MEAFPFVFGAILACAFDQPSVAGFFVAAAGLVAIFA